MFESGLERTGERSVERTGERTGERALERSAERCSEGILLVKKKRNVFTKRTAGDVERLTG